MGFKSIQRNERDSYTGQTICQRAHERHRILQTRKVQVNYPNYQMGQFLPGVRVRLRRPENGIKLGLFYEGVQGEEFFLRDDETVFKVIAVPAYDTYGNLHPSFGNFFVDVYKESEENHVNRKNYQVHAKELFIL